MDQLAASMTSPHGTIKPTKKRGKFYNTQPKTDDQLLTLLDRWIQVKSR